MSMHEEIEAMFSDLQEKSIEGGGWPESLITGCDPSECVQFDRYQMAGKFETKLERSQRHATYRLEDNTRSRRYYQKHRERLLAKANARYRRMKKTK